ncbi:conserved hypothetical protein [Paraburkholderia tropica]|uniref:hypothetical protein n=1 Tax=Paraburkholderia tropica TaxID=92647 RepID=UPI001CAC0A3C|nr:hypothetical protein [Paraburkholderia tropica]CAG9207106.1 conserved hypothetical protein [Paraburkholderia tropica]
MQLGGTTAFSGEGAATHKFNDDAAAVQAVQAAQATTDTKSSSSTDAAPDAVKSQDDAVRISPQGYAAAANDDSIDDDGNELNVDDSGDSATPDASADGADGGTAIADSSDSGQTDASADGNGDAAANAQPMKSLVYGAFGLERPDQEPDPNQAYSTGRWIAAAITVGGIVSLFI